MVKSNDLPGVEVWIEQNGQPVSEYEDKETAEGERTTTRYIEARTGQEFTIHFKAAPQTNYAGNCLSFHAFVDGIRAKGAILSKEWSTYVVEGARVGPTTIRKLAFAEIETVSDENGVNSDVAKAKALGSIVVTVTHKNKGNRTWNPQTYEDVERSGFVSEKAIKGQGVSHSVVLGASKVSVRKARETKTVHGVPDPAAVFIFHYRSIDALKAMLIIPRTPSPPPLEERDITSMSKDELLDFQKQFKALKAKTAKIKREGADDNPRPRKVSRPKAGDAQLEIDDDGNFREGSSAATAEHEVIVID